MSSRGVAGSCLLWRYLDEGVDMRSRVSRRGKMRCWCSVGVGVVVPSVAMTDVTLEAASESRSRLSIVLLLSVVLPPRLRGTLGFPFQLLWKMGCCSHECECFGVVWDCVDIDVEIDDDDDEGCSGWAWDWISVRELLVVLALDVLMWPAARDRRRA